MVNFYKISALLALVSSSVLGQQQPPPNNYKLLKDTRADIKVPKYTPDQKQLVADQALNFFKIYVNRDSKIKYYNVDPLPTAKEIVKKAAKMSDMELHKSIQDLFFSVRDLHQNYFYPAPHRCYTSALPVSFKQVLGGRRKVIASSFSSLKEILELAPEYKKISLGDELVTYNGKTVNQIYAESKDKFGGANKYGGFVRVLGGLSAVNHRTRTPPENNDVVLVFKKHDTKDTYTVKLPWVSIINNACLKPAVSAVSFTAINNPTQTKSINQEEKVSNSKISPIYLSKSSDLSKKSNLAYDIFQEEFNHIFGSSSLSQSKDSKTGFELKPTEDGDLFYSTIKNKNGNFGYILLKSFAPKVFTVDGMIQRIRSLLLGEFKDTDGLIFDTRSNGGGYANLADSLVQLFTSNTPRLPHFYPLNNELNRKIFANQTDSEDPWAIALKNGKVKKTAKYFPAFPFTELRIATEYGQAYFKPMATFTDARCYSACDMFNAIVQDTNAGPITSEDLRTGAGGANVVETDSYVGWLPSVFKTLPFGGGMRCAWRQAVRTGKNKGKIIEDIGVVADLVVKPTVEDILGKTQTHFDRITKKLKEGSSKKTALFQTDPNLITYFVPVGKPIQVEAKIAGINKLVVLDSNEKDILKTVALTNTKSQELKTQIQLKDKEPVWKIITFEGHLKGKKQFFSRRKVQTLPSASLTIKGNYKFAFKPENFFVIYNLNDPKSPYGFTIKNNALVLPANGQNYKNDLTSFVSFFVDLTSNKKVTLNLLADIETEKDFDFLYVIVKTNKEEKVIFQASGNEKNFKITSDLSPFVGGKVEVQVKFVSDSGVNGKGVTIKDISFSEA